MLNVRAQKSPAGAKAYFAKSDYYSEGQELVGNWGGKGAVLLGLFGEVQQRDFDALCDNLDPRTGEKLTVLTRDNRRVGYDFTWSAPKSISMMHALTGDEGIVQAFRESINDTMGEMESEMQTRVRRGGKDEDRTSGNLAWAEFVHLTSRPVNGLPAPQLHAHCFAFNTTFDPIENRWKAGQFGKIKGDGYYWQAVQQARFASRLQELGYSIRPTKDAFEIDGVPESVMRKFSLRSKQIRETAAELGITDPKGREKLAATTREAKDQSMPYPELVETWDKMLEPEERVALLTVSDGQRRRETPARDAEHVRFAAEHLFERASVLDERRLLTLALRHGIGEATPEQVRAEVKGLRLMWREEKGHRLVTSRAVKAEEDRMLGFAAAGKGTMRPMAAAPVPAAGSKLAPEQWAVVHHVLTSTDRVVLIRGAAGTGKSTLAQEAVRRITREAAGELGALGRPVVMVAPTAAAVDVLKDDGFKEAATLQRLLVDENLQNSARGGVIWLDEAGLVGTRSMADLFALAQKVNARVVLMGDKRQLPSVERGAPLRVLEDLAGLKVAEITTIRRQSGKYKEAVQLLSDGKADEGLKKLDALGWVKLTPVWDGYGPVAEDYAAKLKAARDKEREAVIVVPTHAEGAKVGERVRQELKKAGLVGKDDRTFSRLVPLQWSDAEKADQRGYAGDEVIQFHHRSGGFEAGDRVAPGELLPKLANVNAEHFATYREGTIAMAKGDLIRITAKGKSKDGKHTLGNGSIYRVKGFSRSGDVVLTNNWVLPKDFGHWNHAYVRTIYGSQGRTVNHVIVVQSAMSAPASSREGFYVSASRGRKSLQVWTDDKRKLLEAAARSRPRLTATELLRRPRRPAWRCMRDTLARVKLNALLAARKAARQVPRVKERDYAYAR